MSLHNAEEPMDPGDLGPKHRVFLCHSGAQKGFVEQLDKDLRSADRYPFFDKDRDSLPIGDNFPFLIFQAIELCQVGVVFLSKEFFMQSPWPMFEVVRMVECGRRIMPIFLGISPEDLSNEKKAVEWKLKWEGWMKVNRRIDVAKWESTLRSLRPLNGLVYKHSVGVVKFREEIVREICKIVSPFHVWDDSHVQGKSRISKVIQVKISKTTISVKGVQVVGLYGVGGIGKTTACKCLCRDLTLKFDGRVCHIEFGDDRSEIDRVREVLKRLTSTDRELLKERNLDECWSRLKDLLQLKKVVLAIDNVSAKSKVCGEVGKYLRLQYSKGSIVMVAARALGELGNLGIKMDNCLAMPELVEGEARALLLHHAEPENEPDEDVVMQCITRCYFGKGDGINSKHYHPLALKVLGSQLCHKHPSEWISQLEEEDVFNHLKEDESPVLSILKSSFDALKLEYQMLFMDVALFDDGGVLRNLKSQYYPVVTEVVNWYTIFDWLSMVHGYSVDEVKKRLNELKRKSLLEELGDGVGQIGIHDLWREFAAMKAKHEDENPKWVYEDQVAVGEGSTESCMSGGGWKSLRRICILGRNVKSVNFNECSEVIVLRLSNVFVGNEVLDLSHLKSIKSLEIVHPFSLERALGGGQYEQQEVSGIGQLSNLVVLTWLCINSKFVSVFDEILCLTNLRVLHLGISLFSVNPPTSLNLERLRYLEDVRLSFPDMVNISGFSSKMKGLRILDLGGCYDLRRCVGVGDVDSLEVLLLHGCYKLEELPNLEKLKRLQFMEISNCKVLKTLPGLGSLVALRELRAREGVFAMKELPDMSNLAKLEVLELRGCYELKCISGLDYLFALRVLGVRCHCLHDLPNLTNLRKLQKVRISGEVHGNEHDSKLGNRVSQSVVNLAMLGSISELEMQNVDGEVTDLCKLTALKSLVLVDCKFERFPDMGSDMRLESLVLLGLGSERHLQVDWSSIGALCNVKELDLRHFPQLRHLHVRVAQILGRRYSTSPDFVLHCGANHMHLDTLVISGLAIKELPDLSKFPSLQDLYIGDCKELTSLTISEPLQALSNVVLSGCKKLYSVPNIIPFPRLTAFEFRDCGVQLNEHEVQELNARGFRDNHDGKYLLLSSRNVDPLLAMDLNRRGDEEVAVDVSKDLNVASEPCTSKFIPYDESVSESGRSSVPERALKVGSHSGIDQEEQTEILEESLFESEGSPISKVALELGSSSGTDQEEQTEKLNESLTESGRSPIPERVLEVGSSNGTDEEEQTEKLKDDEFLNLCLWCIPCLGG